MAKILDLPEEVLILIFKELWPSFPLECQKVCRAWYLPAHKMVLQEVRGHFDKILRFIWSIDSNPHPAYLNAVEEISIEDYDCPFADEYVDRGRDVLDQEYMIEKLFYRFPNLKKVALCAETLSFKEFNDEICKTILEKCPKLESFVIYVEYSYNDLFARYSPDAYQAKQDKYLNTHLKLRLLLTSIKLSEIDFRLRPESPIEFISKFPRLKYITGVRGLNNFEKLLPVFKHLSYVTTIKMEKVLDDQDNFAETYLATKPKSEQEQLVKALSSIEDLELSYKDTFGANSMKFVVKYFTGLQFFKITSNNNQNLTNLQRAILLDTINLVCNNGRAYFSNLKLEDLSTFLPGVIAKLYNKPCMKKELEIKIDKDNGRSEELVHLTVESIKFMRVHTMLISKSTQKITINVSNRLSLFKIAAILSSASGIETFSVDIDEKPYQEFDQEITTAMYDEFLAAMPSVKKVKLEIPRSYVSDSHAMFPSIEKMTLQAIAGDKTQAVLDEFSTKFPNLKKLKLFYFGGILKEELKEYQVLLPNYSLEKLALDLTPVRFQMIRDRVYTFLVVQVSITASNEQRLYKIQMNNKFKTFSINEADLTKDDDYYRLHITINDLQRLDVYVCLYASQDQKYLRDTKGKGRTLFDTKKEIKPSQHNSYNF